jgi:APA family basic amino acid/polyamine antiporter
VSQEPAELARRLGTTDAVVVGLGAMIGAGVFSAIGPAGAAAGWGLLIGLVIAAIVAYCNAASSAQLAALHPESGGTYVYGRARLGHLWGFLAGWAFVVGKTASCAAMAFTFGAYVDPSLSRPLAVGAVVALTAVNLAGIQKTAALTRAIIAAVLATLAVVIASGITAPLSGPDGANALVTGGVDGVLQSAGLLFFAFAGYARIATLGGEVRRPEHTIPRAIPLALGITLVVYAAVAVVALSAVGPSTLASSSQPLTAVVEAGGLDAAAPVVGIGAAIGSLGVLLSLLVGVSRTTFAMARGGDLPAWLGSVEATRQVPRHAELAVAAVVVGVVLVADLRGAIGFSSFAVLTYYAIANASAWTLGPGERRWPRPVAGVGLVGCVVVALFLPTSSVLGGLAVLAVGLGVWVARELSRRRRP